jgi:hypothetical protein
MACPDSDCIARNSPKPESIGNSPSRESDHSLENEAAELAESGNLIVPVSERGESPTVEAPAASTPAGPFPFIPPRVAASANLAHSTIAQASEATLRRHQAIRTYDDLERRCIELGSAEYLIDGILPTRSIGLLVGDSGLGKSALLYQAAICIAGGVPFLGHTVRQGRVLYLDYENGLKDSQEMARRLCEHLGLSAVPPEFYFWNYNDCSNLYGSPGNTIFDMINLIRPSLTIIDSLTAFQPQIEEKNAIATEVFQSFRRAIRDWGTTVWGVHHTKKPSTKPGEAPPALDEGDGQKWFLQARGPRALINGSDVRLGVDLPGVSVAVRNSQTGSGNHVALIMRGFGRVRGEIGPLFIARSYDSEGEPMGYRCMIGVGLLFNPDQQAAFTRLPRTFSFGDAQRAYGRGPQATTDFLQKCQRQGLLRKQGRGRYEKREVTE